MRDEYDFSKGERGRFFYPDAEKKLPICREAHVLNDFEAKAKGAEPETMVDDLLKKDTGLVEEFS